MRFLPDAVNTLKKLIDDGHIAAIEAKQQYIEPRWIAYVWNYFIEFEETDLVFLNSVIEKHFKRKPDKLKTEQHYTNNINMRLWELEKKPDIDWIKEVEFIKSWCPISYGTMFNLADHISSTVYGMHRAYKVKNREANAARDLIFNRWYKQTNTFSKNLHSIKELYAEELELQKRVKVVVSKRE